METKNYLTPIDKDYTVHDNLTLKSAQLQAFYMCFGELVEQHILVAVFISHFLD